MKPLFLAALLLASTAGAQVQKWEYLALTFIFSPVSNDNVVVDTKDKVRYTYGQFNTIVIKALKLTKNPIELSNADYLNYFGSLGWELAGVDESVTNEGKPTFADISRFYFKRPIVK